MSIFTITPREELSWRIEDAAHRMMAASSLASKIVWARRMNGAKRERGDFERITEERGRPVELRPVEKSEPSPTHIPS